MSVVKQFGPPYLIQGQTNIHGVTVAFLNNLTVSAQTIYKVITADDGGRRIKEEEIEGEAGELNAILMFQSLMEWKGEFEALNPASAPAIPLADFPIGNYVGAGYVNLSGTTISSNLSTAAISVLGQFKVISAEPKKSKGQIKMSVHILRIVDSANGGMTIA